MNLPPEVKDILITLLKSKTPEIILRGKVDVNMEEYVFWAFAHLRSQGSPTVNITIDSGGGDADEGHNIYDVIKNYPGETIATVYSGAHSAASLILQACKRRRIAFHATMVIHNPSRSSVSYDQLTSKSRLTSLKRSLAGYQEKLIRVYMLRSGKDRKTIVKQLAKDEPFSSREALEFGLIDEIVGEG